MFLEVQFSYVRLCELFENESTSHELPTQVLLATGTFPNKGLSFSRPNVPISSLWWSWDAHAVFVLQSHAGCQKR